MFACGEPCEASELVHFRNRIGAAGIELILKESIRINGKDGEQQDATTDTTVQETCLPAGRKISPILQTINCIARSSKSVLPLLINKILNYAKAIRGH